MRADLARALERLDHRAADLAGRARDRDGQALRASAASGPWRRVLAHRRRARRRLATFRSMSGAEIGLALSVFLACAVEAVEALTIVMAVGRRAAGPRRWPASAAGDRRPGGVVAALGGSARRTCRSTRCASSSVPCCSLFGAAVAAQGGPARGRAQGAARRAQRLRARSRGRARGRARRRRAGTPYSFAVAFKGVLLEGFEVAIIVITFGANQHRIGLAAAAAGLAVLARGRRGRSPCARRSHACPRTR